MRGEDIVIIILVCAALAILILYYLNRKALSRMSEAQSLIEKNKTTASIYVIDKKKERAKNSSMPKTIISQLPKVYKLRKLPLVKAKMGPQITTFMCDPKVFKVLPVKKTVKVELAGIYILGLKGFNPNKITAKTSFWDKVKIKAKGK